jgi:opacity protein-like surface antigen
MRSVKFMIAAGAASLLSSAAFAADMGSIMPAPPAPYYAPPVEDFGGWYLRGDIGMTNTRGKLFAPAYDDVSTLSVNQLGHGFTGGTSYGVGVGYQFNSWFRADITGEYRSKVMFSGTDFANIAGLGPISDVYSARFSSWVAMANVYVDLGTWWCITPFIGAGVGGAFNQIDGLQDLGSIPSPGVGSVNSASYFANAANKTSFAWAAHAGLAYKVNQNFTVELAYRYLDLGSAVTGKGDTFDGILGGRGRPFQFNDMTSQDIKLGVRWTCCDVPAPAPAPLVRKG